MNNVETPLFPIKSDQLEEHKDEVTNYLKQVEWNPPTKIKERDIDISFLLRSQSLGQGSSDSLSLLKNAIRISNDRIVLDNQVNKVVNAVRKGFMIGRHLAATYEKASGLETLINRSKEGSLHLSEQPELNDKRATQCAILLFGASSYIAWNLESISDEGKSAIEFGGVPEVSLSVPTRAMQCAFYYYCGYVERSNTVNTPSDFVHITKLYFEGLMNEILLRKESLAHRQFFEQTHYKLEHEDFSVKGFEPAANSQANSIQFNTTRMDDIVGNRDAKHMFSRYVDRLCCYDAASGKNPMLELGGLPAVTMADGKPGTGKSMIIAATATLLSERCKELDMPFLFWPLPENIISTYQGGSAERAMEWFRPMTDASKIIFAPIDDAENNLEERTRKGVSAGVREFIGVFLRNTEGAYAINRGNRLISLFTNIPDQIDKAVLSRIQVRVSIDGADRSNDFMDQDYLWWRKYEKLSEGFTQTKAPDGYEFMKSQRGLHSLNEIYDVNYQFKSTQVKDIYEQVLNEFKPDEHDFFGSFYSKIQDSWEFFSSRDLRNIQKAVDARLIDFDLPTEYWENHDLFFRKDYDGKLHALQGLMKDNLKGLSFYQVRLFEALNYIETSIRINETGIEREIEEAMEQMRIQAEARKRM